MKDSVSTKMIDMKDEEFKIIIRKDFNPKQSIYFYWKKERSKKFYMRIEG